MVPVEGGYRAYIKVIIHGFLQGYIGSYSIYRVLGLSKCWSLFGHPISLTWPVTLLRYPKIPISKC